MGRSTSLLALLVVSLVCLLTGCYRNLPYRTAQATHPVSAVYDPEEQECRPDGNKAKCHPYYQAYIEFDEFGEMWDPKQLGSGR